VGNFVPCSRKEQRVAPKRKKRKEEGLPPVLRCRRQHAVMNPRVEKLPRWKNFPVPFFASIMADGTPDLLVDPELERRTKSIFDGLERAF
jgi:hypothetical protein